MGILPPLPQLISSVSADIAKLFLDRHGWDRLTALIRKHGFVPSSSEGRTLAAATAFVANGIMDWHMAEDSPTARFAKELLRDVPSELVGRLSRTTPSVGTLGTDGQHPLYRMETSAREALLKRYRGMNHSTQNRLRSLLSGLRETDLTVLATASEEDIGTLMDLLAPTPVAKASIGQRIAQTVDGLTNSLFPFMGNEERKSL